jgi:hypothetical protein
MRKKSGLWKVLAMVLIGGVCSLLIMAGTGYTEIFSSVIPTEPVSSSIPATVISPMPGCSGCTAGTITCCEELASAYRKLYQRLESLEARQAKLENEMTELQTSLTIKLQQLQAKIKSVEDEAQFEIEQLKCKISAVESVAARERAKLELQISQLRHDVDVKTQALQNDIMRVERRAEEERVRLERIIELTQQQEQQDVRRLERKISELQTNTNHKILVLQDSVKQLYGEVTVQRERILALEAQVKEVAALRIKVAELEQRICSLEATLAKPIINVP